ncbi:dienelactone hydrolase [Dysgonomonadaceae bacterium PH5-43]|nr:dienelactone hydrolase [Dysgonomonadaceae bacterium PH5-43]
MKKVKLLILLLTICTVAQAQSISGNWFGLAKIGASNLRLVFELQQKEDSYTGKLFSIDQAGVSADIENLSFSNNNINLEVPSWGFVYKGVLNPEDETIEGSFTQMGQTFELNLSRKPFEWKRPQEPKAPFPYISEDVTFKNNNAGITLAGTFTRPIKDGVYPTVIMVSGSGPQDRNEELFEHKPFLLIADYLTRNGIAVLRYDDRGIAQSEGNYASATVQDFTEDARAALDYIKTRNDVNSNNIGIIGHSLGGGIAFVLAAEENPSFIISLAGVAVSGRELMSTQQKDMLRAGGAPDDFINPYVETLDKLSELAVTIADDEEFKPKALELFKGSSMEAQAENIIQRCRTPEIMTTITFEPYKSFKDIHCAVLALNGEKDLQVNVKDNFALIEMIRDNGNNKITTKSYPRLNHLFQTCETGAIAEYQQIEETISPEVLKDMVDWIKEITK